MTEEEAKAQAAADIERNRQAAEALQGRAKQFKSMTDDASSLEQILDELKRKGFTVEAPKQ